MNGIGPLVLGTAMLLGTAAHAAAVVGQPAPAFKAVDTAGKAHTLADYKGKVVVLEWVNPGCPFVRKHYDAANMQGTQRDAAGKGVVWLAVNSTATGSGDYKPPAELAAWMAQHKAAATATLMDADGTIGKAYGAKTTPQLYVIDAAGKLAYAGAIDSKPTANAADIAGATNHVKAALGDLAAGKAVATAVTQPYGCSVKYAS